MSSQSTTATEQPVASLNKQQQSKDLVQKRPKSANPKKNINPNNQQRNSIQNGSQTNGNSVAPKSRAVYVNNIFFDDLDQSNAFAEKFKEQRIFFLTQILGKFGHIEDISREFDQQQGTVTLNILFTKTEEAEAAVKSLKDRDLQKQYQVELKSIAERSGFPHTICPQLQYYKYGFASASKHKTKLASSAPKPTSSTVAPAAPTTASTTPVAPQEVKEKQTKKKKEKKEQKEKEPKEQQQQAQQEVVVQQEKKEDAKPTTTTTQQKEETTVVQKDAEEKKKKHAAEELRREAELAKVSEEVNYLNQQLKNVHSQLEIEKERYTLRDSRINKLTTELHRLQLEAQRLSSELTAEQDWKRSTEDNIAKLEAESNHIRERLQKAEHRYSDVNSQKH